MNPVQDTSLTELAQNGEQIYLNELKDKLEKTHMGEHVVIDVDSKKYFVDKDPVVANEKARREFPNKLFFMTQIGTLHKSSANSKKAENYGWVL